MQNTCYINKTGRESGYTGSLEYSLNVFSQVTKTITTTIQQKKEKISSLNS